MKRRHHKRLCQVVKMLAHSNHIILLAPCAIVYHPSLHPRAKGANRVLLHALLGSFDNGVGLDPVGHVQGFEIGLQGLRLVFFDLGVDGHRSKFEFDWCHFLKVFKYMNQWKWILAATQCNEHPISVFNHFKISYSCAHLPSYCLRKIH